MKYCKYQPFNGITPLICSQELPSLKFFIFLTSGHISAQQKNGKTSFSTNPAILLFFKKHCKTKAFSHLSVTSKLLSQRVIVRLNLTIVINFFCFIHQIETLCHINTIFQLDSNHCFFLPLFRFQIYKVHY